MNPKCTSEYLVPYTLQSSSHYLEASLHDIFLLGSKQHIKIQLAPLMSVLIQPH